MSSRRALGLIRICTGLGIWLDPLATGRMYGLSPDENAPAIYLARLFGIRDIALAILASHTEGRALRLVIKVGIAVDAFDVAASVIEARSGRIPAKTGVLGGLSAGTGVILGIASLRASRAS
jgi:hypothetical protein